MKVFLEVPSGLSQAMFRITDALSANAPDSVELVLSMDRADVIVLHTIGYPETVELVEQFAGTGQQFVLAQYCFRTTQRPHASDWLPLWNAARLVWSYYDLAEECRKEGLTPNFNFFKSPLGADASMFRPDPSIARRSTILTSGYVAESEGVKEAAEAVRRMNGYLVHLGPNLNLGPRTTWFNGVHDRKLAKLYSSVQYVAGLRRGEGFELPAAEGLLCGARPVMFDAPHYRAWFEEFAEFVPEGSPDDVTDALERVFRGPYRPVTPEEIALATTRFNWETIAHNFWERMGA